MFRGCADAQYAFDPGCSRELQAVQVVIGKKSVDVEILLCFCNDDTCNQALSGANSMITTFRNIVGFLSAILLFVITK